MKRPRWWPPALWPAPAGTGGRKPGAAAAPETARSTRIGSRDPSDPGPDGSGDGWASYLDVLVAALQARRAVLWDRNREGGRWTPMCQRSESGWSGASHEPVAASGHPFTWSVREELLLQLPCERLWGVREDDGWLVVVPDPRTGRVLSLWFASPPGPGVRKSLAAVRAHLAWLDRVQPVEVEHAGPRRVRM